MDGMVSIVEWAREKGISKQWAITLASDGRLPGAMIVDNYRWMVPIGTVSPTRKRSDRMIEAERKRVEKAREREDREANRAMVRMRIDDEESAPVLDERIRGLIDDIIRRGQLIGANGYIYNVVDGQPTVPAVALFKPWIENPAVKGYYLSVKDRKPVNFIAPVVEPVDVPNAPDSSNWPDTDAEWENQENIREGVHGGLTLDAIKAQCDGWGNSEQAFYQSLVAANPL